MLISHLLHQLYNILEVFQRADLALKKHLRVAFDPIDARGLEVACLRALYAMPVYHKRTALPPPSVEVSSCKDHV